MSKYLSVEEVQEFWALGIGLEGEYVPDEEWERALREDRVQETSSYSSMGTAETGWIRLRPSDSKQPRGDCSNCAVVPPGQIAEHTEWEYLRDDRDVIGVCWVWFWNEQRQRALYKLPVDKHEAFLAECAQILVELEQAWKHDRDNPKRQLLVDWLISANKLDSDKLEAELAEIKSSALSHLVRGVKARWITRDVALAFDAVLASAKRGKEDYYKHGNVEHQRVVRMQMLRCIARLARGAK
jgi:hypothetical protein